MTHQGRFPVRVELKPLDKAALIKILAEKKFNLIEQTRRLLATEGITLDFTEDGIDEMAGESMTMEGNNALWSQTVLTPTPKSPSKQRNKTPRLRRDDQPDEPGHWGAAAQHGRAPRAGGHLLPGAAHAGADHHDRRKVREGAAAVVRPGEGEHANQVHTLMRGGMECVAAHTHRNLIKEGRKQTTNQADPS